MRRNCMRQNCTRRMWSAAKAAIKIFNRFCENFVWCVWRLKVKSEVNDLYMKVILVSLLKTTIGYSNTSEVMVDFRFSEI